MHHYFNSINGRCSFSFRMHSEILFADKLGAGRFAKIGIPNPDFFGTFVGTFEIVCGLLVLVGLLIRLAAIPLICIMLVAHVTTTAELLAKDEFWETMHVSRTDRAMLLGTIFLLIKGGGKWSIDNSKQHKEQRIHR